MPAPGKADGWPRTMLRRDSGTSELDGRDCIVGARGPERSAGGSQPSAYIVLTRAKSSVTTKKQEPPQLRGVAREKVVAQDRIELSTPRFSVAVLCVRRTTPNYAQLL